MINILRNLQRSVTFKSTKEVVYNSLYRKKSTKTASKTRDSTIEGIPEGAIEVCHFENGMRLISECKDTFTTTIGCYLPIGAMCETPEERGSALFLEHLLFRQTATRNQQQIEADVEDIGGIINTIAMRDLFLFYGTVASCNAEHLIELFADVILNGIVCDQDVAIEKSVILNRLANVESDKELVVMDYLPTIAFQNTPLANSIYPNTNAIRNLSVKNLSSYRDRLFKVCTTTMVSTGSLPMHVLQELICKYFDTDLCQSPPVMAEKKCQYRFSGADLRYRNDNEEVGYVALGIEGPTYEQCVDRFALNVAKEVVGSWDMTHGGGKHNAPFIAHNVYNANACYMYKSFFQYWLQSSIWGCYFIGHKMHLDDMIYLIQRDWMKLCTSLTRQEIQRAVNQCKIYELMKLNCPVDRLMDLVESFYRGGYYESMSDRLARYEALTLERIREAADKYVYDQAPAVVGVGRIENLPDYCNIQSGMYLLRY